MDDLNLDGDQLKQALADIRLVNRVLGGHAIGLSALKPYMKHNGPPVQIVDIGCGNGEFLRVLAHHCRKHQISMEMCGWDMNPRSLAMARTASQDLPEIRYEQHNVLESPALPAGCVVICNLFMHHFSTSQIRQMLKFWISSKPKAIIINDLHRHAAAYYLFRLFGRIFMKSRVARHDGAISIQRGFRASELRAISAELKCAKAQVSWKWAFRYLWRLEP
jgi:2-polyprenyl-3-methyl-5-hydroxy-6-metoxy-1,4-benzoquinol methylase